MQKQNSLRQIFANSGLLTRNRNFFLAAVGGALIAALVFFLLPNEKWFQANMFGVEDGMSLKLVQDEEESDLRLGGNVSTTVKLNTAGQKISVGRIILAYDPAVFTVAPENIADVTGGMILLDSQTRTALDYDDNGTSMKAVALSFYTNDIANGGYSSSSDEDLVDINFQIRGDAKTGNTSVKFLSGVTPAGGSLISTYFPLATDADSNIADNGVSSVTKQYDIQQPNTPPVFNPAPTNTSLETAKTFEENQAIVDNTISATDSDAGDTVSYAFCDDRKRMGYTPVGAQNASDLFLIDSNSGAITVSPSASQDLLSSDKPGFDYEKLGGSTDIFYVCIEATDGNGGTAREELYYQLLNVDDTDAGVIEGDFRSGRFSWSEGGGYLAFATKQPDDDDEADWAGTINASVIKDEDGNPIALDGYIYGDSVGYIDIRNDGNSDDSIPAMGSQTKDEYGVTIDPNADGILSGNIWGELIGWIAFNDSNWNEGNIPLASRAKMDLGTGELSGYAWSETSGWISFSGAVDENGDETIDEEETKTYATRAQLTEYISIPSNAGDDDIGSFAFSPGEGNVTVSITGALVDDTPDTTGLSGHFSLQVENDRIYVHYDGSATLTEGSMISLDISLGEGSNTTYKIQVIAADLEVGDISGEGSIDTDDIIALIDLFQYHDISGSTTGDTAGMDINMRNRAAQLVLNQGETNENPLLTIEDLAKLFEIIMSTNANSQAT